MLPHDPHSSAEDRPGEAAAAVESEAAAGPEAAAAGDAAADRIALVDTEAATMTEPPAPTGLVDLPTLTPVVATQPERRRGWPVAVAMVLVAVMGGGALFMSGYTVGRDQSSAAAGAASERDAWQPFWDVYDAVRNRYPLEPVDRSKLIEGAIRGLVESVGDPYSSYLSPEDFRGTLDDISGTFEGIGAEIGSVDAGGNTSDCSPFGPNCFLVVIAPLDGSPAEKAGLRPGDVILRVDGSSLDGLTPDEARDRVRGKAGTEVQLHILRFAAPVPLPTPAPGESAAPPESSAPREPIDEFDVTVVRDKIQRREVTSRELADGDVGYVSLSGFSSAGAKEVEEALKTHLDNGITKIVFDLRGNPGGFLLDSLDVASEFIAEGPIYWQEDARGNQVQSDARAGGIATSSTIEVVVLIDRGTASAAEIVAGALQDRERAVLIGETSFGKGTVQEWLDLGEVGGVKLTVSKWLTPDKRWIHRTGLTPDIAVTVPADAPTGSDPVLDEALETLGESAATGLTTLRAA